MLPGDQPNTATWGEPPSWIKSRFPSHALRAVVSTHLPTATSALKHCRAKLSCARLAGPCLGGQQKGDGTEQKTSQTAPKRDEPSLLNLYRCKGPALDLMFL